MTPCSIGRSEPAFVQSAQASRGKETRLLTLDNIIVLRYYLVTMIKSFEDRETERVFERRFSRRLPESIQRVAQRKLLILDAAETLQDLRVPPSNRLEKLSGDRQGQYSIRINDQWRICFVWHTGDAYSVEIVDYH
jgi:proteic killer suppression protein